MKPAGGRPPLDFWFGWVVAFLEGEGTFRLRPNGGRIVAASQKTKEPLVRLRRFLGGKIWQQQVGRPNAIFTWEVYGLHATAVAALVYPHMSSRRKKQIRPMLAFRKRGQRLRRAI